MRLSIPLLLVLLLGSSQASGQNRIWNNSQTDNDFANLLNWTFSEAPPPDPLSFTGFNADWRINLSGANRAELNSAIGDVQRDISVGRGAGGELFISGSGSLTATRDVYAGSTNASGNGVFTVQGTVGVTQDFLVGDALAEGRVFIEGGTVNVTRNMRLGRQGVNDGYGQVTVNGDALTVGSQLFVGQSNRAQNMFTLNSGTVSVTSTLNVAHQADTQGSLIINGGSLTANNGVFADGGSAPSTATLTVTGGSLTTTGTGLTFAAKDGGATATVNLSDTGAITSNTSMSFGFGLNSVANLNMTGGALDAPTSFITFGQGADSTTTVTMSGGEINADRTAWANNPTASTTLNMSGGSINMVASVGSTAGTRGSLRLGEGDSQLNLSGTAVVVAERLLLNAGGTIDLAGSALLHLQGSTLETAPGSGVLESDAPTFSFAQQFFSGLWAEVLGTVNFSSIDSELRVVGASETIANPTLGDPDLVLNFVDLFNAAIANGVITSSVSGAVLEVEFDGTHTLVRLDSGAAPAEIVNRFAFHAAFAGGGSNIDSGKVLALEGAGPQALSFVNLINTSQGINGVGFDIQDLANPGSLSASDFDFQVSPTGSFDEGAHPPSGWIAAPAPSSVTVTPGTPSRVLVQWPNFSIMNQWLRVTVKANTQTGLATPQSFYLGHLLGKTGEAAGGNYTVSFADISPIRAGIGQSVGAENILDIDKSGTISFADISAMRPNVGALLRNITIP